MKKSQNEEIEQQYYELEMKGYAIETEIKVWNSMHHQGIPSEAKIKDEKLTQQRAQLEEIKQKIKNGWEMNAASVAEVGAVIVAPPAPDALPDDTGLSKRERQIRAIEAEAELLGYKKLEIKTGCKSVLRKACKEKTPGLFGAGNDPFNDAWKDAINAAPPRLRMADHNKFAGK